MAEEDDRVAERGPPGPVVLAVVQVDFEVEFVAQALNAPQALEDDVGLVQLQRALVVDRMLPNVLLEELDGLLFEVVLARDGKGADLVVALALGCEGGERGGGGTGVERSEKLEKSEGRDGVGGYWSKVRP